MEKVKRLIRFYKGIYKTFNSKLKKGFIFLILINIFFSLIDLFSILSIAPIIAIVTNESLIFNNKYFLVLTNFINFEDKNTYIMLFSFFTIFMFIINFVCKLLQRYIHLKYSNDVLFFYTSNIYSLFLYKDYLFHSQSSSSDLITNTHSDTERLQSQLIAPSLEMCSNIIILIVIYFSLLFINPLITSIFSLAFVLFYLIYFSISRASLSKSGRTISDTSHKYFKALFEGFKGIREAKLYNKIQFLIKNFNSSIKIILDNRLKIDLFSNLPRQIIELISLTILILVLNILLFFFNYSFDKIAILLSIYVLSLTKLMPAMQKVFLNLISISSYMWTYDKLKNYIENFNLNSKNNNIYDEKRIFFKEKISLKNISFQYPGRKDFFLKDINLEVKKNEKLSIIGGSGSGKSTLCDILSGLLFSEEGKIHIDGKELSRKNINLWQKNISYVSQNIYLSEGSIIDNITFSNENEKIDENKIKNILKSLKLDEFLDYLNRDIGELGKKMSGGQRQRLSIARALYRDSELLLIDEGTSALDKDTSDQISDYIFKKFKDKTLIVICHSKELFNKCEKYVCLDKGKVISKGMVNNAEELILKNLN